MQPVSQAPGGHAPAAPVLHRASLPFARRLQPQQGRIGFALCSALSDRRVWVNSRLLAWVLLPDGWQGLVQSGPLEHIELRLACAREAGTRAWGREGGEGPLWAFGGRLLALSGTTDARDAARELVRAPLRAGLAERIGDYPFWDAVWLGVPTSGDAPSSLATTT